MSGNGITGYQKKTGHYFNQFLGYTIALVCLVWLFHDFEWGTFFNQVKNCNPVLIMLAIMFDIASYTSQGWRLQQMLSPIGKISVLRTTQAVYIGLFTNEILPLHVGELVRPYLISRWLKQKFVTILSVTVIERIIDGLWLAIGIGFTAIFVKLPTDLMDAADVFGILILICTVLLVLSVFYKDNPQRSNTASTRRPRWWQRILDVKQDVKRLARTRSFYKAILISTLVLIFQIIAFWVMMRAYNLSFSIWVGAAVLIIEHLGTMVPNAPSNIGTYQFFTVLGLAIFGVDKVTATGFSIVVFLLLTIPLWLIGLIAVRLSGLNLKQIRSEISLKFHR
jgi:uncharacterized protein (TIRG00374 family)